MDKQNNNFIPFPDYICDIIYWYDLEESDEEWIYIIKDKDGI